MFWIGDKYYSGEDSASERRPPDLERALHRMAGREDLFSKFLFHHEDEEEFYGTGHRLVLEYAGRADFPDIECFFVTSHLGRQWLRTELPWREWLWQVLPPGAPVEPNGTSTLRSTLGEVIESGWLLSETRGRRDEDITWSEHRHLMATATSFIVLECRLSLLH